MAGKSMGSGNYLSFNVGSTGGLMQGSVDDLFARPINNFLKACFFSLFVFNNSTFFCLASRWGCPSATRVDRNLGTSPLGMSALAGASTAAL